MQKLDQRKSLVNCACNGHEKFKWGGTKFDKILIEKIHSETFSRELIFT